MPTIRQLFEPEPGQIPEAPPPPPRQRERPFNYVDLANNFVFGTNTLVNTTTTADVLDIWGDNILPPRPNRP